MGVVNATPRPFYPRGRDTVTIVQDAGWDPGPVRTGAENLIRSGIRSRNLQPVANGNTHSAIPDKNKNKIKKPSSENIINFVY